MSVVCYEQGCCKKKQTQKNIRFFWEVYLKTTNKTHQKKHSTFPLKNLLRSKK